jgi:aryl-alcohol dehydrogenase-like predicted oxidoreductase
MRGEGGLAVGVRLAFPPESSNLMYGMYKDTLHVERHRKIAMKYTTLGKTGLKVSVAGLGTGGFSRLGLKSGKTEDESARLIHEAVALGVNFIDTAASYGTEPVVGKALRSIPRDQVVIATKAQFHRGNEWTAPEKFIAGLDHSLRVMGTDYVDVFNLHGVEIDEYDYAIETLAPALLKEKQKGKIRHIGLTENPIDDFTNAMLKRALRDPVWEVYMVGFHMMHQGARQNVFPATRKQGIGTLLMFAVRSMFADRPRIAREMKELAAKGLVEAWLGESDDPLGFLIHAGGAATLTEAAYRYARHEPGVDVVLFGTGDAGHLKANVAALLKPPLPEADRAKLAALFGHLTGVGLDGHQGR